MPGVAFSDNPMTLTKIKWKAVLFCVVFALAVSCSGIPAADIFVAPRIVETSCTVDENTAELTCVYSTKLGFKQFGFSYGSKEGGMTDVISTDVQPHEFKVRLTDLQYDSTYTYYAFISNGSRRYPSFESEFKTEPCPEEKSMIDKYFADQDFLSKFPVMSCRLTVWNISRISGLSPVQVTTFRHIWICLALKILSISVFLIAS